MTGRKVIYRNEALIPDAWKHAATRTGRRAREFRAFNPTLIGVSGGYAMCYRVVAHNSDERLLATCLLTRDLQIVPGSVTAVSDRLKFAAADELNARALTWHADPRYQRLRGDIYLIWNDGANRPENHQFMARMGKNGLAPKQPARAVCLPERRPMEKNWMFFETGQQIWAVYSVRPHVVLAVDFDQPKTVDCTIASTTELDSEYENIFGFLRGGAQPLLEGDHFTSIIHSSYKTGAGRHYRACLYRFAAVPPFEIVAASTVPFDLPNPCGAEFLLPRLNNVVDEVIYPSGLVRTGREYVVSYGINDERCAIAAIDRREVEAALVPIGASPARRPYAMPAVSPARTDGEDDGDEAPAPHPPLFWWNAVGKRIDKLSTRRFEAGNFGDLASRDVVARIVGRPPAQAKPGKKGKLLAIGSVLHTAENGDVIWGAGVKGSRLALAPRVNNLSVHAVRGPLSVAMLRKHDIDVSGIRELFDPGCLLPLLFAQEIAAFKEANPAPPGGIRIIPHYRDDMVMRRRYYKRLDSFVSVDCEPLEMIFGLLGAERVFSSSLHGLIFAESLGIPAYWLLSPGGEDGYKFYDYYYGTERYAVKRYEDLPAALAADPMPLPDLRLADYLATFPHEAVAALPAEPPAAGGPESATRTPVLA